MKISKKEIKKILINKSDEYTEDTLVSEGTGNFANHLIDIGADIYHAQLITICLLVECMFRTIEVIRLKEKERPTSFNSEKHVKYFKKCATQWWGYWVINEASSNCDDIYNDLFNEMNSDMDFWKDRRKDVEKAWKIITRWRIYRILEWERETFQMTNR